MPIVIVEMFNVVSLLAAFAGPIPLSIATPARVIRALLALAAPTVVYVFWAYGVLRGRAARERFGLP